LKLFGEAKTIEMKLILLILTTMVALGYCEATNITWYDKDAEITYHEADKIRYNAENEIASLNADIEEYRRKDSNAEGSLRQELSSIQNRISRLQGQMKAKQEEIRINFMRIQKAQKRINQLGEEVAYASREMIKAQGLNDRAKQEQQKQTIEDQRIN